MTDGSRFALDTSVAVPLLVESHEAHELVVSWARGRVLGLSGHALVETYSVLTRLPGDARVSPADAVMLIDENFAESFTLSTDVALAPHRELARFGVSGGAAYDGLVALAAREEGAVLVTRDARARSTYEALGARVHLLADTPTPG
ncbi:type II toxin-antitoxin system VapC family toxin [Herbiconiux ginsengi]|uniref:Ribonuclease VapC n=1 Tax=Herbiconiux ginsengi TaxID=381665 RepID=A0A1H3TSK4_9MICO|nr:type II toxin-antitoxin system VapC family toxin [Herbiconiux ginsengi]SDZ53223.1 PIN domain-containing protein [Herbiconiux ginsengi]